MFWKKNIFVSHSSENKEIAEQLCAFLTRLGIEESRIFCSSIVGQGVNNGEKLNDAIAKSINHSKVIVYILSRDFLDSSYCMEELGTGWYLSQFKKVSCFYLILPDMDLSSLKGFVNSKIDKFSFLDETHSGDLGLFAENICDVLRIKLPKHSVLVNAENTFFSATKALIATTVEKTKNIEKEKERKDKEVQTLQEEIHKLKNKIDTLNNQLLQSREDKNKELLEKEFRTIRERFMYLGFREGISPEVFKSLSKEFWFSMVNRYIELIKALDCESDESMAMLLATIYSADGDLNEAYEYLKLYVELEYSQVFPTFFRNVKIDPSNDMSEIIEILQKKIKLEPKGIVQDSYKETVKYLLDRKAKIEGDNDD